MPQTVLIVDDERHIVELLAHLLEDEGYVPRKASNGRGAMDAVEASPPDLVLSDVAMPGLSGIELALRLGERGIPVVLMSAAVGDPALPGVSYVAKPFDLDELLAVIARALAATPVTARDRRNSGQPAR